MVQLKDKNYKLFDFTDEISIPYGSIKRSSFLWNIGRSVIFQFLMVQLKGPWHSCYTQSYIISIPYGSIKSKRLAYVFIYNPVFQFLMVQLKASVCPCGNRSRRFQFLMVQLKAGDAAHNAAAIAISIPYGSIKRKS